MTPRCCFGCGDEVLKRMNLRAPVLREDFSMTVWGVQLLTKKYLFIWLIMRISVFCADTLTG